VTARETQRELTASAPAKVILLGEHAVNRGQPALAAAIGMRAEVTLRPAAGTTVELRSAARFEQTRLDELQGFAGTVDALRAAGAVERIAALAADDFFAPLRYMLARLCSRTGLQGAEVMIRSTIPVGAGLGSGAAVAAALAACAAAATGTPLEPDEVAELAWAADVVAHGGVASPLDATACALGGIVRYRKSDGGHRLAGSEPLTLVVADTGVPASTAAVNARVRALLEASPTLYRRFREIGLLAEEAALASRQGQVDRLGDLMNLNQLVLERLGVSCNEIDSLVAAALEAGAFGAKLSGSGGGGIVVALVEPDRAPAVAGAMEAAGGSSVFVTHVSGEGARADTALAPSPA